MLMLLLLSSSKSFTLFLLCFLSVFRQLVLEDTSRRSKAELGVDVRRRKELGSVAKVEGAGVSRVKDSGLTLLEEESYS